jgi:adenylate kinase
MLPKEEAVILLGPPGSGKTSIANEITLRSGAAVIETGQLLRREVEKKSTRGNDLKPFLESGKLAPSQLVADVIRNEIRQIQKDLILFDGFPRRGDEIESFFQICEQEKINLSAVIVLQVPFSRLIKRLTGRRVCTKCHSIYNINFDPPKHDRICDNCGVPLVHRKDDTIKVVNKRIQIYQQETLPVIEYFKMHYPHITYETAAEDTIEESINSIFSLIVKTRG